MPTPRVGGRTAPSRTTRPRTVSTIDPVTPRTTATAPHSTVRPDRPSTTRSDRPDTVRSDGPSTTRSGGASTAGSDRPDLAGAANRPAVRAVIIRSPEIQRPGLRPLPEPAVLHGSGRRRQIVIPPLLDPHSGPRHRRHGRLRHLDHRRTGQRDPHRLLPPTVSAQVGRITFASLPTCIGQAPPVRVAATALATATVTVNAFRALITLNTLNTRATDRRRNHLRRAFLHREHPSRRSDIPDRGDTRPTHPCPRHRRHLPQNLTTARGRRPAVPRARPLPTNRQ
ncbi:hypothetical protein Nocox_01705 [Nonomuraea coxensis DSM 45129]|uniref:Uncharacterized protein n=1 Tax=Nonomuraea coxensis DSM 45129 TaxID=1122611 RepID=A0ABX8TSP9_9ACTN|nr:hypothetical protein Nocox_01705 [Nonomuraea coxensis DSM 45129]